MQQTLRKLRVSEPTSADGDENPTEVTVCHTIITHSLAAGKNKILRTAALQSSVRHISGLRSSALDATRRYEALLSVRDSQRMSHTKQITAKRSRA